MNEMESVVPKLKNFRNRRHHSRFISKDQSSKIMLYQYKKPSPFHPPFPKPVDSSFFSPEYNSIDRPITPIFNAKYLNQKKQISSDNLNFAQPKPNFNWKLQEKSDSKSKNRHNLSRKSYSVFKETDNENIISVYGINSRISSKESKTKHVKSVSNYCAVSEMKDYYRKFQEKSKQLLKQLQSNVLGKKEI